MKWKDSLGDPNQSRFTRLQKILITILCVLMIIGIAIVATGESYASGLGYDAFTMLRYALIDHPVEWIAGWLEDLSELRSVQQENDELKEIIASQELYKAQLDDANRTIQELEELMDFTSNVAYEGIYASVIVRDATSWSSFITINKGSDDGITTDMAVISSKGLVGKVYSVSASTSIVKLLSDEDEEVNVSVKIETSDGTTGGILESYDASTNAYTIQLFDASAEVEAGATVVTSGSGGVFPSGILVGTVLDVEESYNTKGKVITVTPSVDFNDFSYVSVLVVE